MGKSKRPTAAGSVAPLDWLATRVDFERNPPPATPAAFGLARMRRLLAALGDPHRAVPVVHVAGTKGKGSTVAMLAAILEAAGLRTGRYMSPHVHGVEERICIDGRPIPSERLAATVAVVRPAVEALDRAAARRGTAGPTWFEIVTALAFMQFARAPVDIAVLETGLGGRLDATNVVRPVLSVITSISFDHMGLLGHTIGRIAGEKAGIIKRGRPVVSGARQPSARKVIAATARRRRARLVQLGADFTARYEPPTGSVPLAPGSVAVRSGSAAGETIYRLGMAGRHQAENAALAVMAARELAAAGWPIDEAAVERGLMRASLPARIEVIAKRPLVVVDAAHNVASMESLLETVGPALAGHRPRVLVFTASRDKQIEEMLALARGEFEQIVVTRYLTNPRAATLERLVAACRTALLPAPHVALSPPEALRLARRLAGPGGSVVVAGSFFLAGELGSEVARVAR